MDQKRLIVAIAVSIAILLGFQFLLPKTPARIPAQQTAANLNPAAPETVRRSTDPSFPGTEPQAVPPPKDVPRIPINADRVSGSVSLRGGVLDDLVLRDYHEEVSPTSPLVRILEPQTDPEPNYIQYGWTSDTPGVKLPDEATMWTPSAKELTRAAPLTLNWDNGAGLVFSIKLEVDDFYMFTVTQSVKNNTGAPVALHPYEQVRRDYEPVTAGYYILHEGPLGVLGGKLNDPSYATVKTDAAKNGGVAETLPTTGGWIGITDKYWLTAVIPDQSAAQTSSYRFGKSATGPTRYQTDFVSTAPLTVAPGAEMSTSFKAFAGAKEVHTLARYEQMEHIPLFSYAVDFGWFWFLTKPIFYALDWLNGVLGNFGIAIMVFTVFAKALFFPLANKSYRSMSKMKLLGPKMTALRERLKDEPAKLQSEMMQLYKTEGVNPASGCLPMVVQIPVFFSLYKVIFVTIEMRHAPFFGWIHDLSALDPTNVFNLFGLIPIDPIQYASFLHLSAWTLIMGSTMYAQQQLNPPPPDPMQARLFKFMPLIFMFMMGRFPAGLLIYWSWNNTLTIAQQWLIMRRTKIGPTAATALPRTPKSQGAKS
ncbi:membrane protein insertase YidC [Acidisphaera sp. L21]|uniref:membrane protein insertase YidC n=1 Tax=Acidisphaera sp. L21 TaxID=1641851 RepID=UPI00131A74FD|nr:membrane protein insertase YidC [Acidisphaera sp. L21]